MKQEDVLKLIKAKARLDKKNRKDPRFIGTMGFLVAKGFLKFNAPIPLTPNKRLKIKDAIWAGKTVEPRILEVLPAAILRLEGHFDFDKNEYPELARVIAQLQKQLPNGDNYMDIPYNKIRTWADLPLNDARTKTPSQKRKVKTYRLHPQSIEIIKHLAQVWQCSETEAIERVLRNATNTDI